VIVFSIISRITDEQLKSMHKNKLVTNKRCI